MISDPQAAEYCLLIQAMQQMAGADLTPPADPLLAESGYTLIGYVCGIDEAVSDQAVCMGAVLTRAVNPSRYYIVIRGTMSLTEWLMDAQALLRAHPLAGRVCAGFRKAYEFLSILHPGTADKRPPMVGLAELIPSGSPVEVIGHSLGAAIANQLGLDLAIAWHPESVSVTLLASPRVGDQEYAALFDRTVTHYKSYGREFDLVPHIPAGSMYAHPSKIVWMRPADEQAVIELGVACGHHAVVYGAALYYNYTNWKALGGQAAPLVACIRGPNTVSV